MPSKRGQHKRDIEEAIIDLIHAANRLSIRAEWLKHENEKLKQQIRAERLKASGIMKELVSANG